MAKSSVKTALKNRVEDEPVRLQVTDESILDSGSTLMNLKATGRTDACFVKGGYYFVVGDSSSGKTFVALTCLAEAARNENFKNFRFIYDNNEDGAHFDFEKFFGKKMSDRLEAPPKGISDTVQKYYYNLDDAFNRYAEDGKPFIYILDSENGLSSEEEVDKFKQQKTAYEKGRDSAGSYGDNKAKVHSQNVRQVAQKLANTGCMLIILAQTRDKLDAGMFESKKTRSGGKAVTFFAHLEIWTAIREKLAREVKGKKRRIGTKTILDFTKNRFTGNTGNDVSLNIYRKYGIDDIGDCIDYLVDEKHWKKSASKIDAAEFDFQGTKEQLIEFIEENDLYEELREEVQGVFEEIEDAIGKQFKKRKKRYE